MKKKPHIDDKTFVPGQFSGQSKAARKARADLLAILAAQTNLYVIAGESKKDGGKQSVYAVIFGDEPDDGQRAHKWCDVLNSVPKLVEEHERLRAALAELERLKKNGGTITANPPEEAPGA